MERRFLKQIAEGYLVNHNIYGEFQESEIETIQEAVLNEVNYINDYIYETDLDTYNEVKEMSKLEQQRVFEIYLDMMFAKDNNINEIGLSSAGTPGNTPGVNRSNTQGSSSSSTSGSSGSQSSGVGYGSGAGIVAGVAAVIAYFSGNTSAKPSSSPTPTAPVDSSDGIFGAVGDVADKTLDFIIDILEWIPWGTWVIILAAAVIKRRKLSKKIFQFLAGAGKVAEKVGKFIEKKGGYAKFRYAVIQKNRESCYKQCGVTNLEDMKPTEYMNKFSGDKGTDRARCLIRCYITTEIDKVKLITRMYFICLRQTGNFDRIKDMNTAKLMNLLKADSHRQSSFGLASTCGEYYDEISESMEKINDLIEFFFESTSSQRELKMALQKDIDDVKNDIATMDERELRKFRLST